MKTTVTMSLGSVSKITVSPSEHQVRVKLCESDAPNKDLILEIAYCMAREFNHAKTFRCKVRTDQNGNYVVKGKKSFGFTSL